MLPARARPVPFCFHGFLPPPRTSPFSFVAGGEHVTDAHVLPHLELRVGGDAELAQHAEGTLPRLRDVAVHRLADAALLLRREPELDGGVAIARFGLRLHDRAWARLDDRDRDEVALAGEHLRHPDFLADEIGRAHV